MKILCDQCINNDTFLALKLAGFDAVHASALKLSTATDEEIFQRAQQTRRILLSFDHDFGNILRFQIRNSYGVVIVYIDGMTKEQIVSRTLDTFTTFLKNTPPRHRLIIIDHRSIRMWPNTKLTK
jgi:predicted nuclease of predicted toxin-antitoxin system